MLYNLDIHEKLIKKFDKLSKKNRKQLRIINKKIKQIRKNPYHFKPLKGDLSGARRVHVGSFVLIYEIDKSKKIVKLLNYDHHDKIY